MCFSDEPDRGSPFSESGELPKRSFFLGCAALSSRADGTRPFCKVRGHSGRSCLERTPAAHGAHDRRRSDACIAEKPVATGSGSQSGDLDAVVRPAGNRPEPGQGDRPLQGGSSFAEWCRPDSLPGLERSRSRTGAGAKDRCARGALARFQHGNSGKRSANRLPSPRPNRGEVIGRNTLVGISVRSTDDEPNSVLRGMDCVIAARPTRGSD